MINEKVSTNSNDISNAFNSFFTNIGPSLASKIPSDNRNPSIFMKHEVAQNMVLDGVVSNEVIKIITTLKDGSAGWDDISARIVKCTFDSFITPLTHVLNMSITKGVFPDELKIARVVPLFKSGDPMLFSNYRPVSVLPIFSKILERLMYNRLLKFINDNKILYLYQFGFRGGHSPNLALIFLVDKISSALENGDYVLGLFLDFSKAFDTVNHDILFVKLDFYGIKGTPLNWFKSYLRNRKQYVVYNEVNSEKQDISCGVPQGSILGPLLFLIYINDLAHVSDKLFALLFADDSNMFLSGKDPNELISVMNTEMKKVIDWLNINKLSLNLKKTHFIIFRRKRARINVCENLIVNGITISMTDQSKFLGVIIDKHLSFMQHIQHIKSKISKEIGILYKCSRIFDEKTLLTLYYSFVYPYFNYCLPVWGSTYESYLAPLVILQKKAVRLIYGAKRYDHTEPIFQALKLLKLGQLYVYSIQLIMFKFAKNALPNIFDAFFQRNTSVHYHNTRQQLLYRLPLLRTSPACKTVRLRGVHTFNYFSRSLSYDCVYVTYKFNLKNHILTNNINYESCK